MALILHSSSEMDELSQCVVVTTTINIVVVVVVISGRCSDVNGCSFTFRSFLDKTSTKGTIGRWKHGGAIW